MGRVADGRSLGDLLEFSTRNLDFRVDGTAFSRFFVRLRAAARVAPATKVVLRTVTPDLFFIARPHARPDGTLERAVGDFTVRWSGSNKIVWFERGGGRRSVVKHARFPRLKVRAVPTEPRWMATPSVTMVPTGIKVAVS